MRIVVFEIRNLELILARKACLLVVRGERGTLNGNGLICNIDMK